MNFVDAIIRILHWNHITTGIHFTRSNISLSIVNIYTGKRKKVSKKLTS